MSAPVGELDHHETGLRPERSHGRRLEECRVQEQDALDRLEPLIETLRGGSGFDSRRKAMTSSPWKTIVPTSVLRRLDDGLKSWRVPKPATSATAAWRWMACLTSIAGFAPCSSRRRPCCAVTARPTGLTTGVDRRAAPGLSAMPGAGVAHDGRTRTSASCGPVCLRRDAPTDSRRLRHGPGGPRRSGSCRRAPIFLIAAAINRTARLSLDTADSKRTRHPRTTLASPVSLPPVALLLW